MPIEFSIRNALVTLALAAGLAVAGFWARRHVPLDAIPDLSDNQVIVWAEWPGKSPEDMDLLVTSRLARELQGLPGVRAVRGMSMFGSAYIYIIFGDDRDYYECRTRTLERLSQLQGLLPPEVIPRLGPDATAMGQVYAFTLEGPRDIEAKRYVMDQLVVTALRGVPGVAEVAPVGGVAREYQIDVEPNRLAALGLSLDHLQAALRMAGRDVGAMSVEQSGVETMIRGVGFLRSVEEVEDIVLRGDPASAAGLRLGDVADVRLGGQFRQGLLADEHQEQVGAIVAIRVGEDPKRVIDGVKRALDGLGPALAREHLRPRAFYDRSDLIAETNATIQNTLNEAVITTVIVVVFFLLHVRASLATAVSLPLGMLFSFLVMWAFGVSANMMSLAGIAIAIGVMVDFGIIMTENITQHLVDLRERREREGLAMPQSPWDEEIISTVTAAAREVARPLLTSAATTVFGFLPLFALTGQAGRLFVPLAITKTLAISGAVVVGVLVVPLLCRFLLPPWRLRRDVALALSGLVSGLVFGGFLLQGLDFPMDHARWALHIPGWLAAPLLAALAGLTVWRAGREQLVSYEHNPTSRAIHVAYEWAYGHMIRHKRAFSLLLLLLALSGYLVGLGWPRLSAPLRWVFHRAGADLAHTRLDAALSRAFPGVGSSFLPPLDEGGLLFMPSVPATAGLGETQRVLMTQNQAIASIPEVALVMGKLGRAETALDPAPIGMVETVVLLKPYRDWPVAEIVLPGGGTERRPRTLLEVREALAAASDIPGVAPSWLQPIETRVVMLSTGIRSLMALQLLGEDRAAMEAFAEAAEKLIQGVPGAAEVQMQREGGKPYTEIRLDPARLARFGLNAGEVMDAVEIALGGMPLAGTVEGALQYPVRVRYARERRDDADEIEEVVVSTPSGGSVYLRELLEEGRLTHTLGPMAIRSENGRRTQYVMFNLEAGASETAVIEAADARLREALEAGDLHLPPNTTYRWVGRYEQKLNADRTMKAILAVSLLVIVLLIYIGTRSWTITAIILGCNALVTTAGGFFFVWLWGAQLTTAVAVGFLVLLGVMFDDGILLGTYLHEKFRTPPKDQEEIHARIFEAGLRRRRPAIMTNTTTLLSLLPVLWTTGRGTEIMLPMVLPIIGGMIFDIASLFSVPVFYSAYWERKLRKRAC